MLSALAPVICSKGMLWVALVAIGALSVSRICPRGCVPATCLRQQLAIVLCYAEASPDLANPEVLPLLRGAWLTKLSPVLHRAWTRSR